MANVDTKKKRTRALKTVVNVSGQAVTFEIARGAGEAPDSHTLQPGESCEIDATYANPYKAAEDRDPRPSSIELLTNKLVLSIDDDRAARFRDRADPSAAKPPAKSKAA